jgi:hypothetical protein
MAKIPSEIEVQPVAPALYNQITCLTKSGLAAYLQAYVMGQSRRFQFELPRQA